MEALKNGAKFKIKVRVKNTGTMGGKEVSQCYICDTVSSLIRPHRELKGFVKQYYAPGEDKEICFELGYDELAFYNANADFVCEAGDFDIYVGTSCYAELMCKVKITE